MIICNLEFEFSALNADGIDTEIFWIGNGSCIQAADQPCQG